MSMVLSSSARSGRGKPHLADYVRGSVEQRHCSVMSLLAQLVWAVAFQGLTLVQLVCTPQSLSTVMGCIGPSWLYEPDVVCRVLALSGGLDPEGAGGGGSDVACSWPPGSNRPRPQMETL